MFEILNHIYIYVKIPTADYSIINITNNMATIYNLRGECLDCIVLIRNDDIIINHIMIYSG